MGISDRISAEIGNPPKDLVLSYSNADLAIFKPRMFVEGVNQFDSYHFVIPKIEVSTFFADKKEVSIRKNLVLSTNPGQNSARKEINKAIDFLWENNNLEFSLDILCRIVNLSHYYFIRLFKEHTGQNALRVLYGHKNKQVINIS